jgi:acyl carrier protein
VITVDELTNLIRRELRGKVPADLTIDENTKMDDLGLSSLQITEIVFTLEEDHGVEFDPARAADAQTLGDLVALGNDALQAQTTSKTR